MRGIAPVVRYRRAQLLLRVVFSTAGGRGEGACTSLPFGSFCRWNTSRNLCRGHLNGAFLGLDPRHACRSTGLCTRWCSTQSNPGILSAYAKGLHVGEILFICFWCCPRCTSRRCTGARSRTGCCASMNEWLCGPTLHFAFCGGQLTLALLRVVLGQRYAATASASKAHTTTQRALRGRGEEERIRTCRRRTRKPCQHTLDLQS